MNNKDLNKGGTWQVVKRPRRKIKLDPLLAFALLALVLTLIMEYY